jgi:hypothetical protein
MLIQGLRLVNVKYTYNEIFFISDDYIAIHF